MFFFKFVFWQLLAFGCAGCSVIGWYWQTEFWAVFFLAGQGMAKVCRKSLLPRVGRTQNEHTIDRS